MSDFERLKIHSGVFWDAFISDRGANNLGRLYFWLKRDGINDYDDLSEDERRELLILFTRYKRALRNLFHFDGKLIFVGFVIDGYLYDFITP